MPPVGAPLRIGYLDLGLNDTDLVRRLPLTESFEEKFAFTGRDDSVFFPVTRTADVAADGTFEFGVPADDDWREPLILTAMTPNGGTAGSRVVKADELPHVVRLAVTPIVPTPVDPSTDPTYGRRERLTGRVLDPRRPLGPARRVDNDLGENDTVQLATRLGVLRLPLSEGGLATRSEKPAVRRAKRRLPGSGRGGRALVPARRRRMRGRRAPSRRHWGSGSTRSSRAGW